MKRLIAVLLLLMGSHAYAAPGNCTNANFLTPFAFEELSVSSTAVPLTQATVFPDGLTPGFEPSGNTVA